MKLNLGAADRRIEGFVSVDIAPPADQIVDLSEPWPPEWENAVEEVMALDVCEHIRDYEGPTCCLTDANGYVTEVTAPRIVTGRIHFMNELHRVLVPGGRATIETPNAAKGCGYFQDPTHVSPWCMSTFKYFEAGSFAHNRLAKAYGITAAFRIVSLGETPTPGEGFGEVAWKIKAVLEAVK